MSAGKVVIIAFLTMAIGFCQTDSVRVKDPKTAGYLGLVFPGLGQVYNGKYIKAAIIMGLEVASYVQFQENRELYRDYDPTTMDLRRVQYLQKRNKFAWWMAILYIYGTLDAIVDAHLDNFDEIVDEELDGNQNKEEESE